MINWKKLNYLFLPVLLVLLVVSKNLPATTPGHGENSFVKNEGLALKADFTQKSKWELSPYLSFYEDKTGTLPFSEVLKIPEGSFQKNTHNYPAFGLTHSAIWGKFHWEVSKKKYESDDQYYLVFDYPLLDDVELYIQEGKDYVKLKNGNNMPLPEKKIKHRKTIFKIKSSDPGQTIYFRVKSDDTIELPLYITSPENFQADDTRYSLLLGIYYGVMLAMFIYNLFIYLTIRDRAYLNYVLYIISYAVVQAGLDGFLYEYFFPSNWHFAKMLRITMGNITIAIALYFTDTFIGIREKFPKMRKLLNFVYIASLANAVLVNFNFFIGTQILFFLMMFNCSVIIYPCIKLFRKYTPARLYLISWVVFIVSVFVWGLKLFYIQIPAITPYSMQIGSAIGVILLSFALGNRINLIQEEKESITLEALKQKQTAEKNRYQLELMRQNTRELDKELQLAREIQLSMIPVNGKYKNLHGFYLPMGKIGGDFYDFIPLSNNKIGVFICDVSGHGVPAALLTVMIRSMILAGINEMYQAEENSWLLHPDKFIFHMNNYVYGHLQGNFISAFYGVYDPANREFLYCSAAHPPPIGLHYGDSGKTELTFLPVTPQSPPFGVVYMDSEKMKLKIHKMVLHEKNRIIFYSDGLMDNIGYDFLNYQAGIESFEGTFLYDIFNDSAKMDIKQMIETLSLQLLIFRDDRPLEDDVCAIVLEVDRGE